MNNVQSIKSTNTLVLEDVDLNSIGSGATDEITVRIEQIKAINDALYNIHTEGDASACSGHTVAILISQVDRKLDQIELLLGHVGEGVEA